MAAVRWADDVQERPETDDGRRDNSGSTHVFAEPLPRCDSSSAAHHAGRGCYIVVALLCALLLSGA